MEPLPANPEIGLRLGMSQLTATTAAAWHVLGLLLQQGRPAHPSELVSSSPHLYSHPEVIRFLCSIPNSPIRFVDNHLVTLSQVGVAAIAQFFANSDVITRYLDVPQLAPRLVANFSSDGIWKTYCRKGKRPMREEIDNLRLTKQKSSIFQDSNERNSSWMMVSTPSGFHSAYTQGFETISNPSPVLASYRCRLKKIMLRPLMHNAGQSSYEIEEVGPNPERLDFLPGDTCDSSKPRIVPEKLLIKSDPLPVLSHTPCILHNAERNSETSDVYSVNHIDSLNICTSSKIEVDGQNIETLDKRGVVIQGHKSFLEDVNEEINEVLLCYSKGCKENQLIDRTNKDGSNSKAVNLVGSKTKGHLQRPGERLKNLIKNSVLRSDHRNGENDRDEAICATMENSTCLHGDGREQLKRDKNSTLEKKKISCEQNMNSNERREVPVENRRRATSINKNVEQKPFPDFESYIVEEEEGSGGYGTVYRARRKADGVIFAIKCPHVNANRHYVSNEIKMLERLGGKNFVIKYEGSFNTGSADFLVLEHVEHDRPEILRREMNVTDLLWYAYCLFKALAGLHKQGIVHRDVKPGNFLYSRKISKGYLIDFNLALDMRKKYGTSDSSKARHGLNDPFAAPVAKSLPPTKSRKLINTALADKNGAKFSKTVLPPGNLKKEVDKAKHFTDGSSRNIIKSQGADGSGITSAKDATSTRTSAERLREPLPSQGRKALLSLAHEAMQGGNLASVNFPKSKRKRVAAPATGVGTDTGFFYTTPMPLHANGIAIRGTGLLKSSKGDGKQRREGPGVGTKGFKAPEVLLRSLYQGSKADIWSAGVTLLYLMTGRTPFGGDTHQSIKEIAKLRGSEDLWEVAKLHNNEALFQMELLDVKYLSPTSLRDWCARNTKRRDILEAIPASLFDLVDKCLMVNPRLRISAEEALRHDYFAPCHEALRKQRSTRKAPG